MDPSWFRRLRLDVSAGFSYHGSYVEQFVSELSQITCPVQFHYGDNDAVAPMEGSVSVVQAACADRQDAEVFIYSGGEHSYMFSVQGRRLSRRCCRTLLAADI